MPLQLPAIVLRPSIGYPSPAYPEGHNNSYTSNPNRENAFASFRKQPAPVPECRCSGRIQGKKLSGGKRFGKTKIGRASATICSVMILKLVGQPRDERSGYTFFPKRRFQPASHAVTLSTFKLRLQTAAHKPQAVQVNGVRQFVEVAFSSVRLKPLTSSF